MKVNDVARLVRDEVGAFRGRVWTVKERAGFIDFCKANIVLGTEENREFSGGYTVEPVIATARLFEMFLDSDDWRELILQKSSQFSATSHALMEIVRKVETQDLGNVVYVIHSIEEAKNISERLDGFLSGCGNAARTIEEVDKRDNKTLKKRLPGMNIWFTGAQSAGNMASKPGVTLVINDEVGKHKAIKGEADSIALCRSRIKADSDAKLATFSSPTDEDGQITREAKTGSEHRYFVPCPHCGEKQWFNPGRLRYEHCKDLAGDYDLERVLLETRYVCKGCGKEIEERFKPAMLMAGEWLPTNFKVGVDADGNEVQVPNWVPGRLSAYGNDLMAQWGKSSWGHIAVEAIMAKGDRKATHDLRNNRYGEPFVKGGVATVSEKDIRKLMGAYKRGSVPYEPGLVVFGADTQGDCWKWVMGGFRSNGDCMFSDWGVSLEFRDLMVRARDGVEFNGKKYMAHFCLVDEGGDRTREVRKNLVGLAPWFNGCKGLGGIQVKTTLVWKDFDVDKEGTQTVRVLNYDDDGFKRQLYMDMIYKAARAGSKDKQAGMMGGARMFFPADLSDDVIAELCSERMIDGKWKTHGANDFGDAAKELLIGHAEVGHRFR